MEAMHARKLCKALSELAKSGGPNLDTFVTAYVLLDRLEKDNNDVDVGWRVNGTVRDKIDGARNWFEILCGIGEDYSKPESDVRAFILQDVGVIQSNIGPEDGASSHLKHWPPV
jgi:hypothetical protein